VETVDNSRDAVEEDEEDSVEESVTRERHTDAAPADDFNTRESLNMITAVAVAKD
jgi:hypothetical protein